MLVAGGDSFTDRGVYDTVVRRGKGVDYPFDGGTARVTGHGCCDPVFNDNVVPRYELTGNKGVVRRLFKDAELAIANHEMPVTDAWGFHSSGLRFSGKPELTEIFTRAGIDWMSLANNHIKDYGTEGIADSRRILRRYGIAYGGAGADLEQARRISYLQAGKAGDPGAATLAIIPCVGVVPFSWAGPDDSGGTPCLDRYLVPDIKEAGPQGGRRARLPALGRRVHAPADALAAQARGPLGEGRCRPRPGRAQPRRGCHRGHRRAPRCSTRWATSSSTSTGPPTRWSRCSWRPPSTATRSSACELRALHRPRHLAAQPPRPRQRGREVAAQQVQAASADWLDW